MAKLTSSSIPRAAIRTMEKDLAGVVFEDWESTLAESEILELIKKFKERQKEGVREEKVPKGIKEFIALQKQRKAKEKKKIIPLEPTPIKPVSTKKEVDALPTTKERLEAQKRIEKYQKEKEKERKEMAIVKEIRRRARERERMVKEKMKERWFETAIKEEERKFIEEKKETEKELLKKKKELEEALAKLPEEKKPIDKEKDYLMKERRRIQKILEPILENEQKIEENLKFIEKRESIVVIPSEKRKIEQERQLAEKEREKIEQERWQFEKDLFKIEEQLKEVDFKYKELAEKEAKIKQELEDVKKELEKIAKEKEVKEKEKEIEKIKHQKAEILREKDRVVKKREEIEEELAEIKNEESKVEKEIAYLEAEERVAQQADKQRTEQERAKLEKQRALIEQKRWHLEDQRRKIVLEENRLNVKYQNLLERENLLRETIDKIYQFLGLAPKEMPAPERLKNVEDKRLKESTTQTKEDFTQSSESEKKPTEPNIPLRKPDSFQKKTEKEDEKQKLSSSTKKPPKELEEAEKALRRLAEKRKQEELLKKIEEEREEEERKKEEEFLKRIRGGLEDRKEQEVSSPLTLKRPFQQPTKPPFQPPTPLRKKSNILSLFQQKWVKVGIVGLGILLILFVGFVLVKKRGSHRQSIPSPTPPSAPTQSSTPVSTSTPTTTSEHHSTSTPTTPPTMPAPLVPNLSETKSLEISSLVDVPMALNNFYLEEHPQGKIIRIVVLDKSQNKYLGAKEILTSLGFHIPESFYKAIDNNFTLVFYADKVGSVNFKSFGFVAKKNTPGALEMITGKTPPTIEEGITDWKKTLFEDIKNLAVLLGKTQLLPNSQLKETNYKNVQVNYFDLVNKDCFGACYSNLNNEYFVFSTCCATTLKLIDSLSQ